MLVYSDEVPYLDYTLSPTEEEWRCIYLHSAVTLEQKFLLLEGGSHRNTALSLSISPSLFTSHVSLLPVHL